jgi:hypothetical protein
LACLGSILVELGVEVGITALARRFQDPIWVIGREQHLEVCGLHGVDGRDHVVDELLAFAPQRLHLATESQPPKQHAKTASHEA